LRGVLLGEGKSSLVPRRLWGRRPLLAWEKRWIRRACKQKRKILEKPREVGEQGKLTTRYDRESPEGSAEIVHGQKYP